MHRARTIGLLIAAVAIIGAIGWLEQKKPDRAVFGKPKEIAATDAADKARMYPEARELVGISGYLNTGGEEIRLADLVGTKVILVDFWTYSCINCQRTTPYLNAWYEKYREQGLEIVGVHTPEFEFEKDRENVAAAIAKFGIQYPVAQDNDYATWRAYANRYWPRKYLIDIDGYIVYDHIGEGGYEETERKIQELLAERMARMDKDAELASGVVRPEVRGPGGDVASPEVYFGAWRNDLLANGTPRAPGTATFARPETIELNKLYLVGEWNITTEYAEATGPSAQVVFRYRARDVFTVASSEREQSVIAARNSGPLGPAAGADVANGAFRVQSETLYRIIEDAASGEHTLELTVPAGVRFYTFTFG
ncbi:MAG: redoxin domain-containing protein [Parcubacteria group bacterium]|nr:redoxin domain-containing protein [Parcubacteria group bacterium]